MENTTVRQVISSLMYKGHSDEEIASIVSDIAEAAFEQFTKEAMALFSDDDLRAIDACATQTEADDKIKELYSLYAGKDPKEYIDNLITEQAKQYLDDPSSPNEPQI